MNATTQKRMSHQEAQADWTSSLMFLVEIERTKRLHKEKKESRRNERNL